MQRRRLRFFSLPWRTRAQIERDVDTELAFHLDMRKRALVESGLSPAEAEQRARTEFGDLTFTREYCRSLDARTDREVRTRERLGEWLHDARYAWRTIRRSPGFTLASLLTLVLAIGANTAIFTVTRAVLLRPLPYDAPDGLVAVYETPRASLADRTPLSVPNYYDYRAAQRTLAGIAAYDSREITWRPRNGDPVLVDALAVTSNIFDVLRVRPVIGRPLAAQDDEEGRAPRVLLSYSFWHNMLGADSSIVGHTLTLNDLPYEVAGVMPDGFTINGRETMWTPTTISRELKTANITRKQHHLRVIARLATGASIARAQDDLRAISRRLEATYPEANKGRQAMLVPLHDDVVGALQRPLLLLQGAALLVLVIACVNLTNLTLSRTSVRRRELALRAALGAGRARLAQQLLTESVLLALVGGALGIAAAIGTTHLLLSLYPEAVPSSFGVHLDATVLAFGILLSVGTGLAFGVLPAFHAAKTDLQSSMRDGGRGASAGRGADRMRRALVVGQVALAVVLLVGAGLLVRSFAELTRVSLGFEPERVLTAQVRVSGERYDSAARVNNFYDRVLDDVRHAPGMLAAGAVMLLPTQGSVTSTLVVDGQPSDPTHLPDVGYMLVRGDYFGAMRIPLERGRTFDANDRLGAPGVVIINRAAERAFFPAGNALGRRVRLGPDPTAPWSTVIGVVGDTRQQSIDAPPSPIVYSSHVQNTWWRSLSLVVRVDGNPSAAEGVIRRAVRSADPALAVRDVRSLDDVLGASLGPRRFARGLVACLAFVALMLAAIGIYGVQAFSVASRSREYGVRLALGATTRDVLMLVFRGGMSWALVGVALGVLGATAAARLLVGLLYGVSSGDVATYAVVIVTALLVVGAACLVPASRATRVDPLTSMREE